MSQVEYFAERSFAIKGTLVFTAQRDQFTIMEDAYLVCDGKKVAGTYSALPEQYRQIKVLDASGKFVIPGTCDIHVHASQAPFQGIGQNIENGQWNTWFERYAFPDEIEGLTDTAAIQELMSRVSAGNKPFKGIEPTLTETENDMANENKTQGFEYGAIAASLGMKDGEVKDVMARISELAAMEPKYREIQKSLSDAQTVIAGKDASIRNLQTDLAAATARLSAYEQKEKDEQASRIETLVENAIAEGKIDREAKTQWVEMAGSNFELAESTLASIPAREKISKEIADDPANIQATAEATKTAEQLMAEKVAEVVGADFKFRKL